MKGKPQGANAINPQRSGPPHPAHGPPARASPDQGSCGGMNAHALQDHPSARPMSASAEVAPHIAALSSAAVGCPMYHRMALHTECAATAWTAVIPPADRERRH